MAPISPKLLLRISEGDESAFSELFYSCHQDVAGYMLRITGSHQQAQDLVQDIFEKIWRNRTSLSDIQQFEAYLFIMCRNLAFNKLKQIAREHAYAKSLNEEYHKANLDLEEVLSFRETANLLGKAIAQLPPQQKKAYQLSREQGLSQEEIARVMGVSLETAKKHIVLALRSIREFLKQHSEVLLAILLAKIIS